MASTAPQFEDWHDDSVPGTRDSGVDPVVIVGSGPAGVHTARKLLDRDAGCRIVIYGDEPWDPYNRVKLSSLLAGDDDIGSIGNRLTATQNERVTWHKNCAVVSIDRQARSVTDRHGVVQRYSRLVLATGSRPHLPGIPGIHLTGVYSFRDLTDAQGLMDRRGNSRNIVVLGGGLLGLETARAMKRDGNQVTVVDHAPRLMGRQLDDQGGELLKQHVLDLGIRVMLSRKVRQVLGEREVIGVELADDELIDCDTLIVAAGIVPNIELARTAGISVGRGVRVDDRMVTSDPRILAVGECTEHRGSVYGLVAPGLEQAAVAADRIAGGDALYQGSISATELKVVGYPVFSMGSVGEEEHPTSFDTLRYSVSEDRVYRKLVLRNGRVSGVIALGPWEESGRLREAVQQGRRIWFWQRMRFARSGRIWGDRDDVQVCSWPAGSLVCNCRAVTRGELTDAVRDGAGTVADLARCTGASSVCGSCKPLLMQLLGDGRMEPVAGYGALVGASLFALVALVLFFLAPPVPYGDTVQVSFAFDSLWRDGLNKQISGFSLLGLSVLVAAISLRKRTRKLEWGEFSGWRLFHVVAGAITLAILFLHTGMRLGHNLNFALMLVFLVLTLAGTAAAAVIALEHRLPVALSRRVRKSSLWVHILLFWPVPALLGLHVLKAYYY